MYVRKRRQSRNDIYICRKELIPDGGEDTHRVMYIVCI